MWAEPLDEAQGLYLSPPWIDSHCHVFHGTTSFGLRPDDIGLQTGVHLLIDAGSAGAETLGALTGYVIPATKTKILAFLNVSAIGLTTKQEYFDMRLADPRRAADAVLAHPALIKGIKARSSAIIVEDRGTAPLRRAVEAAELANCRIMVHMGECPPSNEENLRLLRAGDIVTHCFHGKDMPLWNADGTPIRAMEAALSRGVLLDIGHGAASFDATVAQGVLARGFYDFSISTDLHGRSVNGPAYSLAVTMTKLLALGMPLDAVIRSVTDIPAARLGLTGWCGNPRANGTVFRLRPPCGDDPPFTDAARHGIHVERVIEPVGVIVEGRWTAIDASVPPPKEVCA